MLVDEDVAQSLQRGLRGTLLKASVMRPVRTRTDPKILEGALARAGTDHQPEFHPDLALAPSSVNSPVFL
jgi:hypothetical protein